ncbi:MAG: zinc ribbon domain-containing protein [Candidatus Pacebacteria bacterium]|nr:zinc ribbon domain-containing protein [Candidatus Paceibacterota bacterium]
MFFGDKKHKNELKCSQCKSKVNDSFSFCPYCGEGLIDPQQEMKDFGMLGRNDAVPRKEARLPVSPADIGFTDQLINSFVNSLAKTLDQQFKEMNSPEVEHLPNGIKIKIGPHQINKKPRKEVQNKIAITDEQIQKMSGLPRIEAKTNIRRFSDKIVYEMSTPGLESVRDVFISKLESGYEIKAIGSKKVYVNSLPINLPLQGYAIENGRLFVEFKTQEQ